MNKETFKTIASNTVMRLMPENLLRERVRLKNGVLEYKRTPFLNLNQFKKIFIVSIGKASLKMFEFFNSIVNIDDYIIVNPYYEDKSKNIYKSSHPFLTNKSFECSQKIIEFLKKTTKNDIVIFLISGGSSSLIDLPQNGLTEDDLIEVNKRLLLENLDILSINNIRQSISLIKGGGLLNFTLSETVSFILSDISGGFFEYVGSGPTVWIRKDNEFYKSVFKKLNKINGISSNVLCFIKSKLKKDDFKPEGRKSLFVKTFQPADSLNIFCNELYKLGYNVKLKIKDFNSDIDLLINKLCKEKNNLKTNEAIAINGEVLYKVNNGGYGGRVQEFCLRMSFFADKSDIFGGIATDGVDGITEIPVAGAFVNGNSLLNISQTNIKKYIDSSNSNEFLKKYGFLLQGGYTGTNLCDIYFFIKS
ncbi:MAG: DUF4147 domain-containing protein [Candidatus Muirbacterium halophilum]|nr:DUF4147 domain-containing protein [Candidatus Muirbacterium halophilum]MCK9477157.1 DUF4147 domain-containing protein [Candidatus Muirbacterium halophilum]